MPQNCTNWQYHSTIKHLLRLAVCRWNITRKWLKNFSQSSINVLLLSNICCKFVEATLQPRIAQWISENYCDMLKSKWNAAQYFNLIVKILWRRSFTQHTVWWRIAFQYDILKSEMVVHYVVVFLGRQSRWKITLPFGIHIARVFFTPSSLSWWNCRPRSVESFDWKVHSFTTVGMYTD